MTLKDSRYCQPSRKTEKRSVKHDQDCKTRTHCSRYSGQNQ